jgi:CheY-like chemotaxis protein/anti-sigma regulatory factor (Ser/Thr protein kinase)
MLAARRGGEVTQQLLAFSRRQFIKPETINLNRRLMDFQQLLRSAAREAVEVELDLDPGLDPVRLDPGHFEAAVLNLVGNARDAMPDGGRIVIATRNVSLANADQHDLPPGAYVRVTVRDTGTGMDPDTVTKAFEPFFTTKDIGKGSGLGLSQVYGFAKQAGGDVRIISTPAAGTTVEILLPRASDRTAGERPGVDAVPLRSANAGEVVLVVEDEPGVLAMTVDSLRDLGYATLTATTAQAALDLLRRGQRVDVLFSDVVMPGGMNGLQLSVEARRLRPDLKVLLTSGYTGGFDTAEAPDFPLLTKPYDRGQLASQLRAVLQG